MVFIDGENLVTRYEAMKWAGRKPVGDVQHQPTVYVWSQNTWMPPHHIILRSIYYTYVQGDDAKADETSEAIRRMTFLQYRQSTPPRLVAAITNLYPKVYKKPKGMKAKGVDIQMTVDILTNTYQDNMDSVYLLSGDGDYKPVVEECMRRGKQVYIAAFSSGLNESLRMAADHFTCLDDTYFEAEVSTPPALQATPA